MRAGYTPPPSDNTTQKLKSSRIALEEEKTGITKRAIATGISNGVNVSGMTNKRNPRDSLAKTVKIKNAAAESFAVRSLITGPDTPWETSSVGLMGAKAIEGRGPKPEIITQWT